MGDKYVTINEAAILYTTRLNNNVLIKEYNGENISYKFFVVNDTGKMILELIDGTKTIDEFVYDFVRTTDIDFEDNYKWIKEFLVDLEKNGAVEFSEAPHPCDRIKNIGANDLISPMHATIEVTDKCNLRCKHCYLEASSEKTNMLSLEKFKKILSELESNMVVNVEFTGGELFVNPDIFEILKLAYQKFSIIGILTNGTILKDEVLNLLIKNKDRTVVNVSIDSTNSEIHDRFRGVPGSFNKTCENIKRMTENGLTVRVASSIFKENMWEIDKLAQLALDLGAKMYSFNFVEEFGRGSEFYKEAYQDLKVEEYYKYINTVIKKYEKYIPIQQDQGYLEKRNCGAGVNSIVIDATGRIRSCVLSPIWIDMGNLLDESFEEIMKKDIYKRLAKLLPPYLENGCDPECKYLLYCKGCYIKGFQTCKNMGKSCSWIKKNGLEDLYDMFKEGKV